MGVRLLTVALAVAGIMCSACSGSSTSDGAEADCVSTFDLFGRGEPLGSKTELRQTLAAKAAEPGTYRLRELTDAAGWNGDWDRVVFLQTGITSDTLNSVSGLPGYCWKSLPKDADYNGIDYFYVFVGGSQPMQAMHATPGSELFRGFRSGDVLLPDTEVRSVQPPQDSYDEPYLEAVSR